MDAVAPLAAQARHKDHPQQALSSAGPGQERALPSQPGRGGVLAGFDDAQAAFDRWRHVYNRERPHQALDFATPAERYRPSKRAWPATLPAPFYPPGEIVRRVGTTKAYISFRNRLWKVPEAFLGETLAIRPRLPDGSFAVCFGAHQIASIDLNDPNQL